MSSRVLVVDDDQAIRELLRFALECEGYDVTLLGDGGGVIEALEGRSEPWVILMDLMMPHVDGLEVCRRLEQHAATLPPYRLALMTGSEITTADCPAPVSVLVRKPFDLDRMVRLVTVLSAFGAEIPSARETAYSSQALAS